MTLWPRIVYSTRTKDFIPMNAMCERAGMFGRAIYDRPKAVFGYFNLSFDAKPPP